MPKRTPPFENYPTWSTARFWGFIRSALRQAFNRYPVKYAVIKDAAVDTETGEVYKTGRRAGQEKTVKMYECSQCKQLWRQKDVQIDHIVPAGSLKSFDDLGPFAERLFCGAEGLQIMCKDCHATKTKGESNEV